LLGSVSPFHEAIKELPRRFIMRFPKLETSCAHLLLLICVCCLAAGVAAQTVTGRISGTITDVSGAVVPGASITAGTFPRPR
jgi:hypothetical protein